MGKLERFGTSLTDVGMLPITVALLGHVVAVLAPLMVYAARDHSMVSLVGMLFFFGVSIALCRLDGRWRPRVIIAVVSLWLLSAGLAGAAAHFDIL